MESIIAIAITFSFFTACIYKATKGLVRDSQIYAGWTLISCGVLFEIDGSSGWATGLILLGALVMVHAGRND